jgi:hypothetical protein
MRLCIHCHDTFDWNLFFDGITALGTLGALIFAIIIARNISFKKELRKKQLDTVFDLVAHLQNLQLFFSYNITETLEGGGTNSYSGDIWFHFFDMTKDKFLSREDFGKGQPTIFVSEKFLYENPIFKYVQNPFLPQTIALKLINIYPRGGNQIKYELNQNSLFISDDREYTKHTYRQEISQYYLTLDKLFETTEDLSKSIRTWLKDNGADDLNFRDRPINIKNYP